MSDEATAAVQKGLSVPLSVVFGDGFMSRITSRIPTWVLMLILAFWVGGIVWDTYVNHFTEEGIACSKQGGSLDWGLSRTCTKIVIMRIDYRQWPDAKQ